MNYHPSEAPELFPETDGLVDTANVGPGETIATLAAISGISSALARRVEADLGALPASVCFADCRAKAGKGAVADNARPVFGGYVEAGAE